MGNPWSEPCYKGRAFEVGIAYELQVLRNLILKPKFQLTKILKDS